MISKQARETQSLPSVSNDCATPTRSYIQLIVNFCASSVKKSGARDRVQPPLLLPYGALFLSWEDTPGFFCCFYPGFSVRMPAGTLFVTI